VQGAVYIEILGICYLQWLIYFIL